MLAEVKTSDEQTSITYTQSSAMSSPQPLTNAAERASFAGIK